MSARCQALHTRPCDRKKKSEGSKTMADLALPRNGRPHKNTLLFLRQAYYAVGQKINFKKPPNSAFPPPQSLFHRNNAVRYSQKSCAEQVFFHPSGLIRPYKEGYFLGRICSRERPVKRDSPLKNRQKTNTENKVKGRPMTTKPSQVISAIF